MGAFEKGVVNVSIFMCDHVCLLSFECSARVPVVMQKSMKNCVE